MEGLYSTHQPGGSGGILPQIYNKKIDAPRLILRHSEGSRKLVPKGQPGSVYLGCEGKGRGGTGTEFRTTLCALHSFINALYIELLRKRNIFRGRWDKLAFGD